MEQAQVRVDHTGDRPTIVKHAGPGPAAERLRREIAALEAAQHPGVVSLVSTSDTDDGVELRTRFGGSRTLANIAQLPVDKAAGIIAALATTLADLHELGITHRRITADHVLIAADGRPIICGLAEAQLGSGPDERHADVAQLGALLRELVAPMDNLSPIPDAKIGRRSSWSGYQRRALLNLADQASADDPLIRPSARQLAANIRATVPGATLPDDDLSTVFSDMPYATAEEPAESRWTSRVWGSTELVRAHRLATLGAGTVGVLLAGALAFMLVSPDAPAGPAMAPPVAVAVTASTTPSTSPPRISTTVAPSLASPATPPAVSPTAPPPSTAAPPTEVPSGSPGQPHSTAKYAAAAGCSTITGTEIATLASGSPCPLAVELADGVVTIGEEQYYLGLNDAAVAIGDFSCSGAVSAAVLDRSGGDIFVFTAWASADEPVTAIAARKVEQGSRLLAEPHLNGCHTLVALDAFGVRHVIPTI